jgi:hypothetical protein
MNIVETFLDLIKLSIDERGVYPHHGLVLSQDDKLTMMAFDFHPEQVLLKIMDEIKKNPKEVIYGLDRTCLSGQGTTLGDCVAGVYWKAGQSRSFIVEYQNEPRIVKEINWENEFWTGSLKSEIDFISGLS